MEVRPIDGNALIEWFSPYLHTDEPIPADVVIEDIRSMPTLTPLNEPLKLEELREMDGEPVYVVSAIGERPEWYIVDIEENEFKNPWDSISLENCDEGYPYTAYRRPPEKEEDT